MNKKALIIGLFTTACGGAIAWYFRRQLFDVAKKTIMKSYFTISELTASSTAKQYNIDNTPDSQSLYNLQVLIDKMLNPIRERYGKPIIVSSGFRSVALNNKLGGSKTSQHLTGQAADLVPANGGNLKDIFKSAVEVGGYDQLIYENNGKSVWVHISYDNTRNRRQILSYKGGKYTDITNNWQSVVV